MLGWLRKVKELLSGEMGLDWTAVEEEETAVQKGEEEEAEEEEEQDPQVARVKGEGRMSIRMLRSRFFTCDGK